MEKIGRRLEKGLEKIGKRIGKGLEKVGKRIGKGSVMGRECKKTQIYLVVCYFFRNFAAILGVFYPLR